MSRNFTSSYCRHASFLGSSKHAEAEQPTDTPICNCGISTSCLRSCDFAWQWSTQNLFCYKRLYTISHARSVAADLHAVFWKKDTICMILERAVLIIRAVAHPSSDKTHRYYFNFPLPREHVDEVFSCSHCPSGCEFQKAKWRAHTGRISLN